MVDTSRIQPAMRLAVGLAVWSSVCGCRFYDVHRIVLCVLWLWVNNGGNMGLSAFSVGDFCRRR
jgi:hypothetical protein